MPLRIELADGGLVGNPLRAHRGAHNLVASGQCARLYDLTAKFITKVGADIIVPYAFVLWLVLPMLYLDEDAMDEYITHQIVGWEFIGAALDDVLPELDTDEPRTPSVLRAELRRAAAAKGNDSFLYTVSLADMYEIFDGATPTDDHIVDAYDWFFAITYRMLLDADGMLSVVAEIEVCIYPRFDTAVAHAEKAPYQRFSTLLTRHPLGVDPGASDSLLIFNDLSAEEMAPEMANVLTRVFPVHDYVCTYSATTTGALSMLREALVFAARGEVLKITHHNVRLIVPHDELLTLIVGSTMGASAALAKVSEIMRIGLRSTSGTAYALDSVPTATAALDFMLAPMQKADIVSLPPTQRMLYFVREVESMRRAESTASGGGASLPRAVVDDERGVTGALGYPQCFQGSLRSLISSAAFSGAVALIEQHLVNGEFDLAITTIFASGHLPLVHALCGQLRALPNVPLVARIVQVLVPLGGQWVGNVLAKALLPSNTTGLKQRRPAAQPGIFKLLTKGALADIPWEDICIEVIAFSAYKKPEGKVPVSQRFTSLERLQMVQPGISALLEGYGKISKKPRSFDYLVDEIVVYDKLAAAAGTPESTRVQVYSTAIVAAFGECAISDALVLSSKDPTDTLPAELVVDGSGALDALAAAKELLPQQAAMVSSLFGALTPAQARAFGHDGILKVPGLVGRAEIDTTYRLASDVDAGYRDTTTGLAQSSEEKAAAKAAAAAKKKEEKVSAAEAERKPPKVGCSHKRLCKETATHIIMGDPDGPYGTQQAAKSEVDALLVSHKRTDACKFSLLSRSKFPGVCCPCPEKEGHQRHDSSAHDLSPRLRKSGLALLMATVLPVVAPSAVPATGGWASGRCLGANVVAPCYFDTGGVMAVGASNASSGVGFNTTYMPPCRKEVVAEALWLGATEADALESTSGAGGGVGADFTTGGAACDQSECGGVQPPVPTLRAEHFEKWGGHIFVPVRYPLPFSPEIGLPVGVPGAWLGEPEMGPEPQTRESVLAVAARWVCALFPGLPHVVPFGQFEDVAHAGGQVTGAVLPYLGATEALGGVTPLLQWVPMARLLDTPLAFVARVVAARMESFARPAPLLRPPEARVGAMSPTAANVPASAAAVLGESTPMSEAEVMASAHAAIADLRAGLSSRVAELRAGTGEKAAFLAEQLGGWLAAIRSPKFGDIAPSVMQQAARLTDPKLAKIALPAAVRPVTTPHLPPLPRFELAPAAAIPGWATNMSHAISEAAHTAGLRFMRKTRKAFRIFMTTGDAAKAWGALPNAMAFGVDHFQPWMAALAVAGHTVKQSGDRLIIVDESQAPATSMNREYIRELFDESGCTDMALYDSALTHGFSYLLPGERRPPMVIFQKPLMSFFLSEKAFLSIHDEALRLSGKGPEENRWFVINRLDRLDDGVLELPCIPCSFCPSGCVPRAKEDRWRCIKNCSAPHTLLLTLAPPCPPLHNLGPGKPSANQ